MSDFLVDHAVKNVWCSPKQDIPSIIKPLRVTPRGGVWNLVRLVWDNIQLPLKGTRFHVFQIGQLHPFFIGQKAVEGQWVKLSDGCNNQKTIAEVYANSGLRLPITQCWFMVTKNRNLILAVRDQPTIDIRIDQDDIFLRIYKAAYFNSNDSGVTSDELYVNGGTPTTQSEVALLQDDYLKYAAKGMVLCWVNGEHRDDISLINVQPGDVVEYLYDNSFYRTIDFSIKSLQVFDSLLDKKRKYLLHYNAAQTSIDFYDDLEIVVYKKLPNNRRVGIQFHRNAADCDAIRMVTHRDWSIPTAYVAGYVKDSDKWGDIEELFLRVYVRRSGYNRPLVFESNRIQELYKMKDADVLAALTGLHSLVPEWRAANLELSSYVSLMSALSFDLSKVAVEDAYGYNAISKLLADTPVKVTQFNGSGIVNVPYGLQQESTAFEYDANGLLLSTFPHMSGSVYSTVNTKCALVEMISGFGDVLLDETYGVSSSYCNPNASYRFYRCELVNGIPNERWVDVTGSGEYAVKNNRVTWLIDTTMWYTLVRSDSTFLLYDLSIRPDNGLLQFTLAHNQRHGSNTTRHLMSLPMGELDIWLNDKALIEHLDYIVQFPKVVIFNKEYLDRPTIKDQRIKIRFTGFCDSNLKRTPMPDYGFITYGQLSRDKIFELRDDKVVRIVVDGKVLDRSRVTFTEDGGTPLLIDGINGRPYLVRDLVVPLRGYTTKGTYEMREVSEQVDKRISDYLTLKNPEPVYPSPPVSSGLYQIFSPFICKIINDLVTGRLNDPRLKDHYDDIAVVEICKPYEWLLEFDPTQVLNPVDPRFVMIHPTNLFETIKLDIYHYKLVSRVAAIYLNDKVNLSHFLQIKSEIL